jgi:glycosyltransferase involved in cell wall biosynthesis
MTNSTKACMKISVIIPAYNAEDFLAGTIDSVLAQTRPPQEIIVVDDGSSDNTAAIVARYRELVRYFHQENRGVSAARNRGVAESTGDYVAFLDADDSMVPSALSRQCEALGTHPEIDVLVFDFRHVDTDGQWLDLCTERHAAGLSLIAWQKVSDSLWLARKGLAEALIRDFAMGPSRSVIGKRALEIVGGFKDCYRTSEDLDLFLRMAKAGCNFGLLREPLQFVLQRPNSLCRGNPEIGADRLRVLEAFEQKFTLDSGEALALRQAKAECVIGLAWREFENKEYAKSRAHALMAMSLGRLRQGTKAWVHTLPFLRRIGQDCEASGMP